MNSPANLAAWVTAIVRDFIRESPQNSLRNPANEKAWAEPLVGFSRGDDLLYLKYKQVVGPFHWTPWEIFTQAFPRTQAEPGELTVISWILPQTRATKADNGREDVYPAERWVRSRKFGEQTNDELRRHVVDVLMEAGYEAVAPVLHPGWAWRESDEYVLSSNWSERHAAHASGLGTFGLCDGLITPVGKAMRAGSAVARIQIPPAPRPYTDHRVYCLFFTGGTCRQCMERCPVGAITEAGHDKVKCRKHALGTTEPFVRANYGLEGRACGLCQTRVPCESGIPGREA